MFFFAASSAVTRSGVVAYWSRFLSLSRSSLPAASASPLTIMRSTIAFHFAFGFGGLSVSSGISITRATSRSSNE
jgi:hypothetical protein